MALARNAGALTVAAVVATLPLTQGHIKVVMQANRNGLFYVLDRATGNVLLARPFVQSTTRSSPPARSRT